MGRAETGEFVGYQRGLKPERARNIAEFIKGNHQGNQIILPILPQTVLLNTRTTGRAPRFTERNRNGGLSIGTLRVYDSTRLAEVDGQHRIRGAILASRDEGRLSRFMLPVSIVDSLQLSQEAAQFVTINTTQKRITPDLALRVVFHRDREEANRLAEALGFQDWKFHALAITIDLNDTVPSPWENGITRPEEAVRRGISERSFLDSLKPVCSRERSLGRLDPKEAAAFLKDFWAAIAEAYPRAWSEEEKRLYLLRKTAGVFSLHHLAALTHDLAKVVHENTKRSPIRQVLDPLFLKFRETAWAKAGRFSRFGTGKQAYRRIAEDLAGTLLPGLQENRAVYGRYARRNFSDRYLRIALDRARLLLSPLDMREYTTRNLDALPQGEAGGAYVLVNVSKRTGKPQSIYVGKSETRLAARLRGRQASLFSAATASDPRRIAAVEGALYHLAPRSIRGRNQIHTSNCPYCR
jgi:DGQHR domain-containing protein